MQTRIALALAIALSLAGSNAMAQDQTNPKSETAPAAKSASLAGNPFMAESTLPFHAPPFDKIKDEHYAPALEAGMAEQRKEMDAIAASKDAPTFDNTIVAMERSGRDASAAPRARGQGDPGRRRGDRAPLPGLRRPGISPPLPAPPGGLEPRLPHRDGEPLMSTRIHRRTLLRGLLGGAAVALGLPTFELFLDRHGEALASGDAFPKRFGVWFWGNGIGPNPANWIPKGTGADWSLSPIMAPLAPVKIGRAHV